MELYEASESSIWTDPVIAANLLQAHLDSTTDAASRKPTTIQNTINWIVAKAGHAATVLDLGCGPGMYSQEFSRRGFSVTGVDINALSIAHAKRLAAENQLAIEYIQADYLVDFTRKKFDLATCIYCDFGALPRYGQNTFLAHVYKQLSPGGQLVFDVFGPGLCNTREEGKTWSEEPVHGFWSDRPHYVLSETKHFKPENVWGTKYIVLQPDNAPKKFILWDHYFTEQTICSMVEAAGFELLEIKTGLIPSSDFACNDVLFVRAQKPAVGRQ